MKDIAINLIKRLHESKRNHSDTKVGDLLHEQLKEIIWGEVITQDVIDYLRKQDMVIDNIYTSFEDKIFLTLQTNESIYPSSSISNEVHKNYYLSDIKDEMINEKFGQRNFDTEIKSFAGVNEGDYIFRESKFHMDGRLLRDSIKILKITDHRIKFISSGDRVSNRDSKLSIWREDLTQSLGHDNFSKKWFRFQDYGKTCIVTKEEYGHHNEDVFFSMGFITHKPSKEKTTTVNENRFK